MSKEVRQEPVFVGTTDGDVLPFNWLDQYAVKAGDEKSQIIVTDRFKDGYQNLIPPVYNLETLASLLELNTWHNRCVQTKANDVAGLGFGFQPAEGHKDPPEADKTKLTDFFSTKKQGRPADLILTDCWTDRESLGCFALEVVREDYKPDGEPVLMAHLPAHTVRVHNTGNKLKQQRGIRKRWFKMFGYGMDVDKENGDEYELNALVPDKRATEVIWDISYSGRSDYYGMPDALPAIGAIEGLVAVRDYNIGFFKNHGIPAWAIYITGDYQLGELVDKDGTTYDPENTEHKREDFDYAIIRKIKRHLNEIRKNPHAPLLMAIPAARPNGEVKIEFKALNIEVKEGSFRLYRKDSRDEIIVAHGVPAYRIGLVETGSLGGNTAQESTRIYRDSVIRPRKNTLAALINKYIIREGFGIEGWEFYFEPLDIAEEEHEKEVAQFMFDNAAMTPNQIIKAFGSVFGLEAAEGRKEMDEYYLKGQPISNLGQAGEGLTEAVKSFQSDLLDIAIKSAKES